MRDNKISNDVTIESADSMIYKAISEIRYSFSTLYQRVFGLKLDEIDKILDEIDKTIIWE